jgi:hypothetical protein
MNTMTVTSPYLKTSRNQAGRYNKPLTNFEHVPAYLTIGTRGQGGGI